MPEEGHLERADIPNRKPVVDEAAKLVQSITLIVQERDDLTLLVILDAKPDNRLFWHRFDQSIKSPIPLVPQ